MDKPLLHFPDGPWEPLLEQAYKLIDEISEAGIQIPDWSMGGGTVLMFHYQQQKKGFSPSFF